MSRFSVLIEVIFFELERPGQDLLQMIKWFNGFDYRELCKSVKFTSSGNVMFFDFMYRSQSMLACQCANMNVKRALVFHRDKSRVLSSQRRLSDSRLPWHSLAVTSMWSELILRTLQVQQCASHLLLLPK